MGHAVARFTGSKILYFVFLGLAPQALCCRSLRELCLRSLRRLFLTIPRPLS